MLGNIWFVLCNFRLKCQAWAKPVCDRQSWRELCIHGWAHSLKFLLSMLRVKFLSTRFWVSAQKIQGNIQSFVDTCITARQHIECHYSRDQWLFSQAFSPQLNRPIQHSLISASNLGKRFARGKWQTSWAAFRMKEARRSFLEKAMPPTIVSFVVELDCLIAIHLNCIWKFLP